MKVVFALHSHGAGGAERHLLQLMQGLEPLGVESIYVGPMDGWLGSQLPAAGFRCRHVPYHGFFDPLSLARLARLLSREKADLVHGHLTRGAHYAGLAGRLSGTPNVATAHSTNAGKHFGRAARIIAVSEAVRRFMLECGYQKTRLRTIHHGVPDYAAMPRPPRGALRQRLEAGDTVVIAMVARFVPDKGHDVLLKALAGIRDRPWTLALAGALDTGWATEMQTLAATLGISERIRFVGHLDDAGEVYAAADLLAAPSRREALSLTLLEAAAFALPIVASDVGGIGEAVADGETGILVPPDDPARLGAAIATLLDAPDRARVCSQ